MFVQQNFRVTSMKALLRIFRNGEVRRLLPQFPVTMRLEKQGKETMVRLSPTITINEPDYLHEPEIRIIENGRYDQ